MKTIHKLPFHLLKGLKYSAEHLIRNIIRKIEQLKQIEMKISKLNIKHVF